MQYFFPLAQADQLFKKDFQSFYLSFRNVLQQKIPSFENLSFFHSAKSAIKIIGNVQARTIINKYFSSDRRQLFCSCEDYIFLTIPSADCKTLAVLTGVDAYFVKKVATEWLEELGLDIFDRYIQIKKRGIDLDTGLLNSQQFFINLEPNENRGVPSVLLVEIYPRAGSAKDAKIHAAKVTHTLVNYFNNSVPLYYLGHGVFAFLSYNLAEDKFLNLGRSLFSWLRKSGFKRVHIGMRYNREICDGDVDQELCQRAVSEAWYALKAAIKRGPYSLCDFDLLSHPEKHPLRRPTRSLLAKLTRRWRATDTFSVVQFEPDNNIIKKKIREHLSDMNLLTEGSDIYLFLPEQDSKMAWNTATEIVKKINADGFRVGISSFPFYKFTKSATVMNCRKALHHADFLGPNGMAVFDSVSLNVSGDIYYAEGDLASAIKEYKLGIDCDPVNINLLNSLGVAYTEFARNRDARNCFKMVLSLDPKNFMALFNLGLAEDSKGNTSEALAYFEKAYQLSNEAEDEVKDDLQFQLGKLYCITGEYKKALGMLQVCYSNSNERNGRPLHFLGRACYGLEMYEDAMTWLQRALHFDEFDSESMGLLGLLYLLRRQGDEIALSLCEKSVDLNPDSIKLKLYLAKSQIACNLYGEARKTLRKCIRNRTAHLDAQLLFCSCYQKEGSKKRARYWLGKVLENKRLDPKISIQASKIGEEIDAL